MAPTAWACRHIGRAIGVALLVLAAAAPAVQASFPGRNGRIAMGYQFNQCDAELTILSMRSNGTQRRVLTRPACDEKEGGNAPDWSPDGQRLVYLTEEGEAPWGTGSRLAVMNSDGSGRTILPIAPVYDGFDAQAWYDDSPSIAPDGTRVAYVRRTERPGADGPPASDIWISGLDGTGTRRLRAGVRPRWSPDGRSIAYVTRNGRLRLMDATDGAVIRELAPRQVCDVDWAPNGRRLVYLRRTSNGECDFAAADVFVVRADGTGDRRLIRMPRPRFMMSWRAQDVAWSPDGRRIAYVRGKDHGDTTRYSLIITDTRGERAKVIYVTERGLVGESLPDNGPTIAWQPLAR